jgi:hypothetical protein
VRENHGRIDAANLTSAVAFLKPAAPWQGRAGELLNATLWYNRNHDPHYRPLGLPISVEG